MPPAKPLYRSGTMNVDRSYGSPSSALKAQRLPGSSDEARYAPSMEDLKALPFDMLQEALAAKYKDMKADNRRLAEELQGELSKNDRDGASSNTPVEQVNVNISPQRTPQAKGNDDSLLGVCDGLHLHVHQTKALQISPNSLPQMTGVKDNDETVGEECAPCSAELEPETNIRSAGFRHRRASRKSLNSNATSFSGMPRNSIFSSASQEDIDSSDTLRTGRPLFKTSIRTTQDFVGGFNRGSDYTSEDERNDNNDSNGNLQFVLQNRMADPDHEGRKSIKKVDRQSFLTPDGEMHVPSRFVMSSTGRNRMIWETIWGFGLLFEMWFIPFDIIFLDSAPEAWLLMLSRVSLGIFIIDIVLNFFTGYVHDKKDEVLDMPSVVKHYCRTWLVLDILATIPWDDLFVSEQASAVSTARSAKASKGLKVMKVLKLVRIAKSARLVAVGKHKLAKEALARVLKKRTSVVEGSLQLPDRHDLRFPAFWQQVESAKQMGESLKTELTAIGVASALIMLLSHIHTVLWAVVLQGSGVAQSSIHTDEACRNYLNLFRDIFSVFTLGSTLGATLPLQWTFEMVVLWERYLWLAGALACVMIRTQQICIETGEDEVRRRGAIKYLRNRGVSSATRVQIFFSCKEASSVRKQHQHLADLMAVEGNQELRRMVAVELWSKPLMTLGLILHPATQNVDFITELAQRVTEETYGNSSIVFKKGTAGLVAYMILEGEIVVVDGGESGRLTPPYTQGMWIGEKSLVASHLRRSKTMGTSRVSSLMAVTSGDFMDVLEQFDLTRNFHDYCAQHLWRGLCGRCGCVGEHFSYDCWKLGPPRESCPDDLDLYLQRNGMSEFSEELMEAGVKSVEDLHDLEKFAVILSAESFEAISERLDAMKSTQQAEITRVLTLAGAKSTDHVIFLSHYKMEAGTEAALLRSELEAVIKADAGHSAHRLAVPIYLDSEDLTDLTELLNAVKTSHNLVLMLTKNVLKRPWCLVEIGMAVRRHIPVIPLTIDKPGAEPFVYPDEAFYESLLDGSALGEAGTQILRQHGFTPQSTVTAIRMVFNRIAPCYSPHKSSAARSQQAQVLLKQCKFRMVEEDLGDTGEVGGFLLSTGSARFSAAGV